MSDRIENEIRDVFGDEVDAAIDTPLVVIEGTKGDPGADGVTPHIGDDGNWYLGTTDTSKPSRGAPGKDGHSPVVTANKSGKITTISVDGAAVATVEDGATGAPGKNGNDAAVTAENITGALGYKPAAPGDIPVVPAAEISANTSARHSHANKGVLDNITAAKTAEWDAKAGTAVATTSANGLMSKGDKAKLDGVEAGANKTIVPTALKNPNALTIKIGSTTVTYDGSAAKTVEIADGSEVSY